MSECEHPRDLVRSTSGWLLWWVPITVIGAVSVFFREYRWLVTTAWTGSLVVMGGACLINARRCGRLHCYFTGPLFLALAAASLLHGTGLVPLGPRGWEYIGGALAIGGVSLYFLPEWLWGRYRDGAHC